MKQTSLPRSWTRSSISSTVTNQAKQNQTPTIQTNYLTDDEDDYLIADAVEPIRQPEETKLLDTDSLISKLRSRPAISYRPSGNDSDHLIGFNEASGRNWIYPLSTAVREYQFHIAEQCLYKNTLVCLPTGLGKTFIAAVVVHNFLRWYPTGKIVFMAPTRPLVSQQLNACLEFGAISSQITTELTGSTSQAKRRYLWTAQRVFFLTPQVLANDLRDGVCPSTELRLLIFDEAHKATGNHAYCQVIRQLTASPNDHRQFRVIALSATPGTDVQSVQALIANLLIAHLELRIESSADVKPYTQNRQLETIVVPLGPELSGFRDQLVECVRAPLDRLRLRGAIRSGTGDFRADRVAKYAMVKARAEWSSGPMATRLSSTDSGAIQADFGLVICLLHAVELLEQHGLRPLYQYFSGVLSGQRASGSVRAELARLPGLDQFMSVLAARFCDGTSCNLDFRSTQAPFISGHPKLDKLKQLLTDHFNSCPAPSETRVIVFSQFRDSVDEILHMLKQLRPLVRPASFIGQSTHVNKSPVLAVSTTNSVSHSPQTTTNVQSACGISQRDQLRVMNAFRSGIYNTLVSTCVGEEGLDVGHVDLIVCFDAFKSPVRLIQRLGRTGRQRFGRIVMLLAEGREERNHAASVSRTASIHKALLEGGAYKKLAFYPHNPRMVPLGIFPGVHFGEFESFSSEVQAVLVSKAKRKSSVSNDQSHERRNTILSHSDALGVRHLPIRFQITRPSRLVTCSSETDNSNDAAIDQPYLTQLYDINSDDCLKVTRDYLHASKLGTEPRGPSISSIHLISVLRLVELHRHGATQLSYHAIGLRSVDTDTPMKELLLLGETEEIVTSQVSAGKHLQERTQSPNPMGHNPPTPSFLTIKFPQLHHGVASAEFFFPIDRDPVADPSLEQALDASNCQTGLKSTTISHELLQEVWDKEIQSYMIPEEQLSSVKVVRDFRQATNAEPDVTSDVPQRVLNAANYSTPRHDVCSPGWESAFHIGSPMCPASAAVIRSGATHGISTHLESPTQISFHNALELLDRSSIRLDVSSLLDEPIDDHSHTTTSLQVPRATPRSAIFTGPFHFSHTECAETEMPFGTKLLLSTDFDEDLLTLTQPCSRGAPIAAVQHSSPHASPQHSEPLDILPDISWSPIHVPSEHLNEERRHSDLMTSHQKPNNVTVTTNSFVDCHPGDKIRTESPQSRMPNVTSAPLKRKRRGRFRTRLLLTQAEASDVDSDDDS